MAKSARLPKRKCCVSKSKCKRCPLRMLKEGTLPAGYTVRKRVLVKLDEPTKTKGKKSSKKSDERKKKHRKKLAAAA